MGKLNRNRPEVDVIARPKVSVPVPPPADLVKDDPYPVADLLAPGTDVREIPKLDQDHDHECRHDTWPEETESTAESGRSESIVTFIQIAGVDGLDGLVGEHEAGYDKKDVDHGSTGEDDAEVGELDEAVLRVGVRVDPVGRDQG